MSDKKQFSVGLIIGIIIAAVFFHFFAPRYSTKESGGVLLKHDRWSGDSWRFVNNQWKKNMNIDQEWEQIDLALEEALNIKSDGNTSKDGVSLLRKKYPILNEITDEELNERIKIVYSKAIMNDLYLSNFLKIQNQSGDLGEEKGEGR